MFSHIKILITVLIISLQIFLSACTLPADSKNSPHMNSLKNSYACNFKILTGNDGLKVVSDGGDRKILISHSSSDSGNRYDDIIKSRPAKVIACSTPVASMINAIGEVESIGGVAFPPESWFVKNIRERMLSGNIINVGGGNGPYINTELIVMLRPDLILVTDMFNSLKYKKLLSLNTPLVVYNDFTESTVLGRVEWVKLIGALYGRENRAKCIFSNIEKEVYKTKSTLERNYEKRDVIWGLIMSRKIYIPGSGSDTSDLIRLAGGHYPLEDMGRSDNYHVTSEYFYSTCKDADVFILRNSRSFYNGSLKEIVRACPLIRNFKSVRNGNVWGLSPSIWQSQVETGRVVRELASIIHPELFKVKEYKFFRKLR